jgi:hypothetical protein
MCARTRAGGGRAVTSHGTGRTCATPPPAPAMKPVMVGVSPTDRQATEIISLEYSSTAPLDADST